jgi:hypothetical protein
LCSLSYNHLPWNCLWLVYIQIQYFSILWSSGRAREFKEPNFEFSDSCTKKNALNKPVRMSRVRHNAKYIENRYNWFKIFTKHWNILAATPRKAPPFWKGSSSSLIFYFVAINDDWRLEIGDCRSTKCADTHRRTGRKNWGGRTKFARLFGLCPTTYENFFSEQNNFGDPPPSPKNFGTVYHFRGQKNVFGTIYCQYCPTFKRILHAYLYLKDKLRAFGLFGFLFFHFLPDLCWNLPDLCWNLPDFSTFQSVWGGSCPPCPPGPYAYADTYTRPGHRCPSE